MWFDFGSIEASGLKTSWTETGLELCAWLESLKRKGEAISEDVP